MALQRKLSDDQELTLALAHYCGVNTATLAKRYSVSLATINHNILGKRSADWDSRLLDFYKAQPERLRNSAHVYVTGHKPYAFGESIVARNRSHPVVKELHTIVSQEIYDPMSNKIAQELGLEFFITIEDSYTRLLGAVFGKRTSEGIVMRLLLGKLEQAYNSSDTFSLDAIYQDITMMIGNRIRNGGLLIGPNRKTIIDNALSTLSPIEQFVLTHRFGLIDNVPHSLSDVGSYVPLPVNRERIRQMESKALRKLKHPSRSDGLRQLYDFVADDELKQPQLQLGIRIGSGFSANRSTQISELNLSVPCMKLLDEYSIRTIGDLLGKDSKGELDRRNTNGHLFSQIRNALIQAGISNLPNKKS